jgi:hypothetical protein
MTTAPERTGISLCADECFAARIRQQMGRPLVTMVSAAEGNGPLGFELNDDIIIGVPQECMVAKQIAVAQSTIIPADDAARFELELQLLDSPRDYATDLIDIEAPAQWLGFAVKHDKLNELRAKLALRGIAANDMAFSPSAIALGKAVQTFAVGNIGDYVAIADICESSATMCFMRNGRFLDVGFCRFAITDWSSAESTKAAMSDLWTVVALHLSRHFQLGVTTPLTEMIVCGSKANDLCLNALRQFFRGTLTVPRLNAGYFADPSVLAQPDIHRFLVPLGLALE